MMYRSYIASEETPDQLLKTIRNRFSDIYKEYEAYESLIDEDSILQYHFIGHEKWNSKEYQQSIKMVKDKVNGYIRKGDDAKALKYIDKYCKELKESFYTAHELFKCKNEYLRDIFILDRTSNFWPLLIKTYKYDKTDTKSQFVRIARLLEVYSFRVYAINQNRGNTGQSRMYSFARDFTGDFVQLETLISDMIKEYSTKRTFRTYLADSNIYNWMAQRDLAYLFWKYENYLRTNKQPKSSAMSEVEFTSSNSKFKLSIEHIASQKPKESIVKDTSIMPDINDEFKDKYLHCLGNLTIDPQSANSSKGNKIFDDKNEKYFRKAPFKTQNELEEYISGKKWSESSIQKRQNVIIEFAQDYWSC